VPQPVAANFGTDNRKSRPRLRAVYTAVNQLIAHRRFFLPSFFFSFSFPRSGEFSERKRKVTGKMRSSIPVAPPRCRRSSPSPDDVNRFYSVDDDVGIQLSKLDFVLNNCRVAMPVAESLRESLVNAVTKNLRATNVISYET